MKIGTLCTVGNSTGVVIHRSHLKQLGWAKGTLKEQLERARKLLRGRLTRRGLVPSAALFATLLSQSGLPAVMPAGLTLEFDPVDVDGGTAVLLANDGGDAGKSDVFVRLSKGTLHIVQMFADGPLYTTTIFPTETRAGKLQAVHTRHEFTAGMSLPGFTWQPEQYYGECEVQR